MSYISFVCLFFLLGGWLFANVVVGYVFIGTSDLCVCMCAESIFFQLYLVWTFANIVTVI